MMADTKEDVNGRQSLHKPLEKSWTLPITDTDDTSSSTTRQQLIDIVRQSGITITTTTSNNNNITESMSVPSSPRKLLKNYSTISRDSSDTLTSYEEEEELINDIPKVVISNNDNNEQVDIGGGSGEFRQRSGSRFYHESFTPAHNINKPVTFIPSSKSAHQLTKTDSFNKKKRSLFSKIRRSFRTKKARPKVRDKKKWVDYEEELDAVSRPSYFRHIGHIVTMGTVQTVELHKPPHGKFGIYIAQGIDPNSPSKKSIFVSRFYQDNMNMFYGNLIKPGDEILAVNGQSVRDYTVHQVSLMLADCQTVQLTVLPFNNTGTTV